MTHKNYAQEQYYWFQDYPYWFKTYSYWLVAPTSLPLITAHPDRQFVVQSESRELEISDERYRIFVVPVEDRTDDIG